jgi:UDP:flavonoid glycosyltransferase YjiC (YdhE family)
MRVLFSTSNWAGHYFAMVPLGWALQAAGYEVRVACTPAQSEAVSRAGLTPVPVLQALDSMYACRMILYMEAVQGRRTLPGLPVHPETGAPVEDLAEFDFQAARPVFVKDKTRAIEGSHDAAVELARQWRPHLVVHDIMGLEGALAARVTGVPSVAHLTGVLGLTEEDERCYLGPPDVTGSFPRHGVEPMDRAQISHIIDPSPTPLQPGVGTATRLPIRYVPYNGSGDVPAWTWTRPAEGRILVIWGNSATGMFGANAPTLRMALEALADLGPEVVLTTSDAQIAALGPLPPRVRVMRNFPMQFALPTCDLVVHHGSTNCLMTAASGGVPQLCLPMSGEQRAVSERLAETGAGIALPGLETGTGEIRAAAEALLREPRYRRKAQDLQAENAARPSPAVLVNQLVDLVM